MMKLRVYSDGASRGNPGLAAIAFKIQDVDGRVLKRFSKCVGVRTNNQAEYEALLSALVAASQLTDLDIEVYADSELLIKQLNMEYKVKNPDLKILWLKVQGLKQSFRRITFNHLLRTDINIHEVDELANQTLDRVK
jgi:ribonuclease HI